MNLGVIELFREPPREPVARFRACSTRFTISQWSAPRTHFVCEEVTRAALTRARRSNSPMTCGSCTSRRLRFWTRTSQAPTGTRDDYERKMGPPPPTDWRNLSELDQRVTALLASGLAGSAVLLLESCAGEHAPWHLADRIATLRLHLGEPAVARSAWENAVEVPQPALREAASERPTWRKTTTNPPVNTTSWHSRPSRTFSRHFTALPCSKPTRAMPSRPSRSERRPPPPLRMKPLAAARLLTTRVARLRGDSSSPGSMRFEVLSIASVCLN